jgi:hypothetical protein
MKDLPTSTTDQPRISLEEKERILEALSIAVELTPLNAPVLIATAYMEGVPIAALAKWFRVPRTFMLDFVNVQLIGHAEVTRLTRATRAKASAMKREEAMRQHPSNGTRPTE